MEHPEILKHVFFVRHGQSESNADGIYRGREAMLTEHGRAQAAKVGARIAKIGVDALVASPFPRALETAAAIAAATGLPLEEREAFGEWAEHSGLAGRHKDEPDIRAIAQELLDAPGAAYRIGDEETFGELTDRAYDAVSFLETHEAKRICVVTHGAFLRILVGVMTLREDFSKDVFAKLFRNLVMLNTGVTYARLRADRGWQLVTWNDISHFG